MAFAAAHAIVGGFTPRRAGEDGPSTALGVTEIEQDPPVNFLPIPPIIG
jgi:hypothetical protein